MRTLDHRVGPLPQVKLEHRSFKTPTKASVDVTTLASNYHIEVRPRAACGRRRWR